MAEGETDDRVSREAHERIKRERDEALQQLEAAKPTLQAVGLIDKAYEHFKGKVPDPYAAARAASRDSMFAEVDTEQLAETFDSWLQEQQSAFGFQSPNGDGGEPDPVPTAPPPGAGRPQPSPSGTGGEPKPEPLSWNSDEVRAAKRRGDRDQLQEWIKNGQLKLSPTNPFYDPES